MPRDWLSSKKQKTVTVRRARSIQDRMADYSEAVALAEAGELMLASDVFSHPGTGRKRILVIGHGCSFSERLGQYALGVAERMGSDLLLLSVGMARHDKTWRESFAQLASDAAKSVQEAAVRLGLKVDHEIRFGSIDQAVSSLVRTSGRIEFILSEPEEGDQVLGQTGLALFTVK